MSVLLFAIAIATAVSAPDPCSAQSTPDDATRATARQLGEQGIEAYWAADYKTANDKLDRAYSLFSVPTLGLWSARARVRLGLLVEAAERYRDAERAADPVGDRVAQKQAQRSATQELTALLPRIPSLTIQLDDKSPADVSITIDGVVMSSAMIGARRPTNPGPHQIEAVHGSEHQKVEVILAEKTHEERTFKFQTPQAPPAPTVVAATLDQGTPAIPGATAPVSSSSGELASAEPITERRGRNLLRPLAVGALSLGGASLLISGITALSANAKRSGDCKDGTCNSESAQETYESLRTTAAVTFYLGAALAVGGLVTLYLAPKAKQSQARVNLRVSPSGVSMHGVF